MSKLKKYKNTLILLSVIFIPTLGTVVFQSIRKGKLLCNHDIKAKLVKTKCSGTFDLIIYEYEMNGEVYEGSESNFSCRLANRKIGDSITVLVSCEDDATSILFDESVAPGIKKRVEKYLRGLTDKN